MSSAELTALQALNPDARLLSEGGRQVALLPDFSFRAAGRDMRMSLLLVPFNHSGYDTRLFFERLIEGRAIHWTQHVVVGRNWWAPSWRGVQQSLPWTAMLCEHLRAVT